MHRLHAGDLSAVSLFRKVAVIGVAGPGGSWIVHSFFGFLPGFLRGSSGTWVDSSGGAGFLSSRLASRDLKVSFSLSNASALLSSRWIAASVLSCHLTYICSSFIFSCLYSRGGCCRHGPRFDPIYCPAPARRMRRGHELAVREQVH